MSGREKAASSSDNQDAPVHRIGMKVVTEAEWLEYQSKQGRFYEKNKKREIDREFDRNQKLEWKGGLEQTTQRELRAELAVDIASEPISRSRIGVVSSGESKYQRRWDDPMNGVYDTADSSIRPKSFFHAPANRFNIPAGYRWDGVVRGNDFEQKWFERLNERNNRQKNSFGD